MTWLFQANIMMSASVQSVWKSSDAQEPAAAPQSVQSVCSLYPASESGGPWVIPTSTEVREGGAPPAGRRERNAKSEGSDCIRGINGKWGAPSLPGMDFLETLSCPMGMTPTSFHAL